MIAHRIFGLLRLQILAQCFIIAVVCWSWLWILETVFYGEPFVREAYMSYFIVAEVALVLEWFTRQSERRTLLQRGIKRLPHTAIRQVLYLTVALTLFLVLTKDALISRAFLLSG